MKLELYKKDTCPFCRKVFMAIEKMGRTDIEMHDIIRSLPGWEKSPGARRELEVALEPSRRLKLIVAPVEKKGGAA